MGSSKGVVGFVGLDDLSLDLAGSLVGSGYTVQGFDPQMDKSLMVEFSERLGGTRCASATEAVTGVVAVVLLISHPEQLDDVIFGQEGIVKGLNKKEVVILRTVIQSADVQKLEKRLTGRPVIS